MKYLLLFTALIATANALNCQCSTCGATDSCTVETKCFSAETEITIAAGNPVKETENGCQDDKKDPNICKQEFILMSSEKDFKLMRNVKCCDTNMCNKDPKFNKNVSSSDLVCPSCFALEKKVCDGKSMKCNNLQKKCFIINGTITKDDPKKVQYFNAKGCAIENTVITNNFTISANGTTYKLENVQLVEAKSENSKDGASQISSCLSFAILLPSVVWFLLDSSLY